MSITTKKTPASALAESLDVSDQCYELAISRYEDVGAWLNDKTKSRSAEFKPRIFPQGSFRLGTVVPPQDGEDYDLDLGCVLQEGVSNHSHSQKDLKFLLRSDLEAYRKARNIQEELEEKSRCWRLIYKDGVGFHMDAVPCLPHDQATRTQLKERMVKAGLLDLFAGKIADNAVGITDNRLPDYAALSVSWPVSNPEGYALWFESRMRLASALLESRARLFKAASIEKVPVYRWRAPLQQALQVLKKHRDFMFRTRPEVKPISIIITTLAAHAYEGQGDVQEALDCILEQMDRFIRSTTPRIPNPVNPAEDFADKWGTAEGRSLQLEQHFRAWLIQARADLRLVAESRDQQFFEEQTLKKFGTKITTTALAGLFSSPSVKASPVIHRIQGAPRPWAK